VHPDGGHREKKEQSKIDVVQTPNVVVHGISDVLLPTLS
jgi:hypothetical protein